MLCWLIIYDTYAVCLDSFRVDFVIFFSWLYPSLVLTMYHEPMPKFIISFRGKKREDEKERTAPQPQTVLSCTFQVNRKEKKRNHHIAFVPFVATDERMFRRTPKASGTLRCVVF